MNSVTWKIGGEAGFGIMTTGLMFSRLAVRHGYHIFDYVEYPSLIRGGHNVYEVRVSDAPVYAQEKKVDFLFALNRETIDLHKDELKDNAIIVYDGEHVSVDAGEFNGEKKVLLYPLPLSKIIKDIGALKVMENNVAIGATLAIFSMDLTPMFTIIEDSFGRKGQAIVDANKKAAQAGFDYVKNNPPSGFNVKLPLKQEKKPQMVLTGNEAIGMGAIVSGCKFFVAYPMTPTSNILHYMAEHGEKYGVVVKHAEDEISVVNMAIGAGYGGVRAMTATAGGGFSLMVEGIGLAGVTETPIVVAVGQRPGPATGMPTWTGQGDLQFIIHCAQDEFPRIILAPGDVEEAFYLTSEAFNLAEKYQTPVFILSDKYLSESHGSCPEYDLGKISIDRGEIFENGKNDSSEYLRYRITENGISLRALPGMKDVPYIANSYEHDEYGWTTENSTLRIRQAEKRARKLSAYQPTIPSQRVFGDDPQEAELILVSWGSTKGPVLQAINELKLDGFNHKIAFLHLTHVWPLPEEQIKKILTSRMKKMIIEGNYYGQMENLIREHTGVTFEERFHRFDGRPFYPEDIKEKIMEVLGS